MLEHDTRLSVADLCAAGVRLRPAEAVTIVRELALQVSRGDTAGVPSAHVIRLSASGTVTIEGPVFAGGRPVPRAAQLLESLLPGFDAPPEFRVPGALRLVVARALGTLDLPPYPSIEAFADALTRFAGPDPAALLGELVTTWSSYVASRHEALKEGARDERVAEEVAAASWPVRYRQSPRAATAPLTISDIRRARRATKLTLTEISTRSRIPTALLRQLEWGYFDNWPSGHYGRTQLIRYARAAGLDDELVVATVWPLLEEAARQRGGALVRVSTTEAPVIAGDLPEAESMVPPDVVMQMAARRTRRTRVLAVLAIPALLVIALVPAFWQRSQPAAPGARTATQPAPAAAAATPQSSVARSDSAPAPRPSASAAPAVATRQPESRTAPAAALRADTQVPDVTTASAVRARPAVGLPRDAVAYSPSFATAGSAMFYHAEADGRSALMRADTDEGGAILKITSVVDDRANNFHARPSPDGSRIAFDSDRDGERGVYIADADGRNVRRVSGDGFAAVPSWSPDGERLAFVRAEPAKPRVWNLWLLDLASGRMDRLTSHRVGQAWGGSWFPDGRRIAYSLEDQLIVLDLEAHTRHVYRTPKAGRLVRTPAVSPDGRRVIFQVYRDGAWMLELADGSMRKVLSDPSAEEYTWAPDGRRVAYHSRRSGEWGVWLMAAR